MSRPTTFVLSDESVNTYGFRIITSGIALEQFKKNPVMYYNHNDWNTPIGRWENIRVEDNRLLADPVFDVEDERGKDIAGKVERGFLKMASVGIRIVDRTDDPKTYLPEQTRATVTRCQLREVSIVGIGSNHNAIRLLDENDQELSEQDLVKLFDNQQAKSTKKMKFNKNILEMLQLSDSPTVEAMEGAIQKLHDEKTTAKTAQATAEADKVKAEKELADANKQLKDIADAKLAEQKTMFDKELDKALKDGRLSESTEKPGSVKQSWIDLYDKSGAGAMVALKSLTPHKPLSEENAYLNDKGNSIWQNRQKEIESKAK